MKLDLHMISIPIAILFTPHLETSDKTISISALFYFWSFKNVKIVR